MHTILYKTDINSRIAFDLTRQKDVELLKMFKKVVKLPYFNYVSFQWQEPETRNIEVFISKMNYDGITEFSIGTPPNTSYLLKSETYMSCINRICKRNLVKLYIKSFVFSDEELEKFFKIAYNVAQIEFNEWIFDITSYICFSGPQYKIKELIINHTKLWNECSDSLQPSKFIYIADAISNSYLSDSLNVIRIYKWGIRWNEAREYLNAAGLEYLEVIVYALDDNDI